MSRACAPFRSAAPDMTVRSCDLIGFALKVSSSAACVW